MKLFEKEIHLIIILILFSASLFSIGLGRMALTDPDESFYAETGREMLERGEWLTPYIFGKPQFEKPPFYYWLVMLGFKAFGINEFASRIGSAVFGIIGVIGIYLLGKLLVSRKTGFFSGIVLATSLMYIILSRACVTDMVLSVFILYAFLFFFYGYLKEYGKTKWYLLSAASLGLAVLTKGPVGVFLPVVIIGIYLIFTKELKKIKEIPFLRGTLIFLAVCLPWYVLMYRVHGKDFIDVFFGFHNMTRFLHPEHALGDTFYYYGPILIATFFPWILILPLGIWQARRETDEKIKKTNLFLLIWFLVIFVFFSLSRTKLPTYIFPIYPALALLVGRFLEVFSNGKLTRAQGKGMTISLCVFLASPIIGMTVLYFVLKRKYPTIMEASLIAGIIFILLMSVSVIALLKKKYRTGLIAYMTSFVIFVALLSYFILPEIGRYESSKEVSGKLLEFAGANEKIAAETKYVRGVAFHTGRENVPDIHPHHLMTGFLNSKDRVWCVLKEKNLNQLYDDKKRSFTTPTYVVYKLGKKVLVTNKVPPSGKFLKMRGKNESQNQKNHN
ncbi:MAG: glycosyltransferase family 39 protein [Candidatus Omnitrophica bacterium]|nr:glycosyltransferase family 39 protein [Candidatus Omnitrophota bacterium]